MKTGPNLDRLLSIATPRPVDKPTGKLPAGRIGTEIRDMLSIANGFFAFESALFVRGFGAQAGDLQWWNSSKAWRNRFGTNANGLYFFAEDLFGMQFAIRDESIVQFDPETGSSREVASSLEDWADQVLADPDVVVGYGLARAWRSLHGPLAAGTRLIPSIPFALGGQYSVESLQPLDDIVAIRERAELARQLERVPDGSKFQIRWRS